MTFFSYKKFSPKKWLSQNFLHDKNIIHKMIQTADLCKDDIVMEIGAGYGAITNEILKKSQAQIVAIEKDLDCIEQLKELAKKNKNIEIIHSDILSIDLAALFSKTKAKIMGNIPFHIASSIFELILLHYHLFRSATLILQSDMAKRLLSSIDSKRYSYQSVALQIFCDQISYFPISKNSFTPKPRVDAALLHLSFHPKNDIDSRNLLLFLKTIFQQRRKQIMPFLKKSFPSQKIDTIFQNLCIDPLARSQNISAKNLLNLYLALFPRKKSFIE